MDTDIKQMSTENKNISNTILTKQKNLFQNLSQWTLRLKNAWPKPLCWYLVFLFMPDLPLCLSVSVLLLFFICDHNTISPCVITTVIQNTIVAFRCDALLPAINKHAVIIHNFSLNHFPPTCWHTLVNIWQVGQITLHIDSISVLVLLVFNLWSKHYLMKTTVFAFYPL